MSDRARTAPYGTWPSPVTPAEAARGGALVEWVGFLGADPCWTEALPEDGGRNALMRQGPDGGPAQLLPPGWDVRSGVIEYGGRPWAALSDRAGDGLVFSHRGDQRAYRWSPGRDPVPLSPAAPAGVQLRYCDFAVRGGEVWCLRERVLDEAGTRVERHLVALPLDGGAADDPGRVRELVSSHHFLTGPRISPDGTRVCWIGWDHPNMPWDGTELMAAAIDPDGAVGEPVRLMGGDRESVVQADWAADGSGRLHAVGDPDGWWNVHEIGPDGAVRNLRPAEEEFGEALWRIGLRWCLPLRDGSLATVHGTGRRRLGLLTPDGRLTDLGLPYTEWSSVATDGRRIAAVVAGPEHRRGVVLIDPADGSTTVVRAPHRAHEEYASAPVVRAFHGPDATVHAYLHPPHHPEVTGPPGELPPYLVFVHGGPNSRSQPVRNQEITYFTSRGIGVVDVQYGGSSGFGRAYRERLRGGWGVVDVEDCATVARALVAEGLADPDRIAIRGGSAGGWTALLSAIAEPGLYRAACLYFPVLDPVAWRAGGTHDFEARYADALIGPWPQQRARYEERSPLNRAEALSVPIVLLQGELDPICPPAQAERLVERLRGTGVPHGYLLFAGERHGFRRSDTVVRCLEAELALYGRTLGFDPA
ncbi:alpha/beta hydrolase family protein [Kitasatospora terrestris]|uniref:Prolyl oligopeptidase family serine peptidase n=1 Tax=Kitasatospora terrestris TaxID=258051 RepID=A0ABP9EBD4_9ACTN